MTNNKTTKNPWYKRTYAFCRVKGAECYKWVYNTPYAYLRVVILAGLAGMWVFDYVRTHITMGDVQAVSAVVAVIVVAHLLGGLKVFNKR